MYTFGEESPGTMRMDGVFLCDSVRWCRGFRLGEEGLRFGDLESGLGGEADITFERYMAGIRKPGRKSVCVKTLK